MAIPRKHVPGVYEIQRRGGAGDKGRDIVVWFDPPDVNLEPFDVDGCSLNTAERVGYNQIYSSNRGVEPICYHPCPIGTDDIEIRDELRELVELLAKNAHDVWAQKRMSDGWRYGETRSDEEKLTPCLVAYETLPDAEREYDRVLVRETLKTILKLGYSIGKIHETTGVAGPASQA